jgi:hypothetical protein
VDGNGYTGSSFGSGTDGTTALTGIGYSLTPFPSYFFDPTNTGPYIYLNALIGAFADSSGAVVGDPFAVNNFLSGLVVPATAVLLLLGLNDDIFADNGGALRVSVEGDGVADVPIPAALPLFAAGLGAMGLMSRRKKRKVAVVG